MDARTRTGDDGFTLVELLVVIVIIGILSAIALPSLAAQTKKGRTAALKSALRNAAVVEEELGTESGYAVPGPAGLAQLAAEGYRDTDGVVLTIIDDDMTSAGRGFCLRAHHTSLTAADDWYYASSGPNAGRPTQVPCVAS